MRPATRNRSLLRWRLSPALSAVLAAAALTGVAPRLAGADCNRNGVEDELDLGFPGESTEALAEHRTLAIAAADLDGDGRLDLVKAETALGRSSATSSVLVLLGNGDGTFQFDRRHQAGDWPWALVTADLNGDGSADLATANRDSADVSVLLGNGDGTFQDEHRVLVGASPQAMVAADFDGDGRLDAVIAGNECREDAPSSVLLVLLGNGDGSFREGARLPLSGKTFGLAAADWNGDGRPDLAAANGTDANAAECREPEGGGAGHLSLRSDAVLLLGNGDGTFQAEQRFETGIRALPLGVAAVDINGDGRPDAAVNFTYGSSILLGNGDGTFQERLFSSDLRGSFATFVDWSGDGRVDAISAEINDPNLGGGSRIDAFRGGGDGSFQLWQCIVVGVGIRALAAADVNADGFVDLASVNDDFADVSVVLGVEGAGGAGFDSGVIESTTDFQPFRVALGDLNGDGRLDLATANRYANDISVLLGNGDGTFQVERRHAGGRDPAAIIARDLNGDGRPDLATANWASSRVHVLIGNGDGSMQGEQGYATGPYPTALAAADVNGDGRPDLVTANAEAAVPNRLVGSVSVLIGNGDGTVQSERRFYSGPDPVSLIAADLDGDGSIDLALANGGVMLDNGTATPGLSILLGNGDGTFPQPARSIAPGLYASNLIAADLNGDGRLDLATGGRVHGTGGQVLEGPGIFVFQGNGDGTFEVPGIVREPLNTQLHAAVDVNRDGRLDLLADFLSVCLGNGDGTFRPERRFVASGLGPVDLAAGDLDGDGFVDVAAVNRDSHDVTVVPGNGDGSFQAPERVVMGLTSNSPSPQALAAADLDGDGFVDISVTRGYTNDVAVRLGKGDGTFREVSSYAVGRNPMAVLPADLDGDGRLDLTVTLQDSRYVSVLPGNGDGTFEAQRRVEASASSQALIADFNGDARADLGTSAVDGNAVSVHLGRGDGSFGPEQRLVLGELVDVRGLVAADLNGDQDVDLALATSFRGGLVLLGNGDGTFQPPGSIIALGSYPHRLIAADFNDDGSMDLASIADYPSYKPHVALGNGDGTFQEPRLYLAGLAPIAIAAADLDGDGRLDLATSNIESVDLSVLLGNGDGTFQEERRFARGNPAYFTLIAADFDGDLRTDLATNSSGGEVSILLNKLGADWAPPRLACPEAMSVRCRGPEGAVVDFQVVVEDGCDPSPALTCDPPPGTPFPPGATAVTCTARDASGNVSRCAFEVTVRCGGLQVPGDCTQDGSLNLTDAVCLLGVLFLGSPGRLPCGDGSRTDPGNAALYDWDARAGIDISDAVGLLNWLYLGGPPHALGSRCTGIEGCPEACAP